MRLNITRSQKKAGMISKEVVFCLNVRTDLTEEEKHAVREYGLGKEVIYNSEQAKKHLENTQTGGALKAWTSLAMAALSLKITIDSLMQGQTVECKSLDEVIGAEEAIRTACENMKQYIEVASQFNGESEVVEF